MSKYSKRLFGAMLVGVLMFGLSGTMSVTSVQAQSTPLTVAGLIELFITIGVIPADKVEAARAYVATLTAQQVDSANSVASGRPVVSLGSATNQISCGATSVDLAWSAVSGATSYNLRVNDLADPWIPVTATCANVSNPNDKTGDECVDGLVASTTNLYSNYRVTPGNQYDFWVDAQPNGTSRMTRFAVPLCASDDLPPTVLAPTLTLSVSSSTIASGSSTVVIWRTENNPLVCAASGDWTGNKSISGGAQTISNITANKTYTLTCTKGAVTVSDTKTVTVNAAVVTPQACTSHAYSTTWSACNAQGIKTKALVSSAPLGCAGGVAVELPEMACTPPPTRISLHANETLTTRALACTITSVDFSWKASNKDTFYNVRLDDLTNGWSATWDGNPANQCEGLNSGDRCWNGYAGTSGINWPVQAGRNYNFWVDYPKAGVTRGIEFNVYSCPTSANDSDSNYATAAVGWGTFLKLLQALR